MNNKGKRTFSGGTEEELIWLESTEATAVLKLPLRPFKFEWAETRPSPCGNVWLLGSDRTIALPLPAEPCCVEIGIPAVTLRLADVDILDSPPTFSAVKMANRYTSSLNSWGTRQKPTKDKPYLGCNLQYHLYIFLFH